MMIDEMDDFEEFDALYEPEDIIDCVAAFHGPSFNDVVEENRLAQAEINAYKSINESLVATIKDQERRALDSVDDITHEKSRLFDMLVDAGFNTEEINSIFSGTFNKWRFQGWHDAEAHPHLYEDCMLKLKDGSIIRGSYCILGWCDPDWKPMDGSLVKYWRYRTRDDDE